MNRHQRPPQSRSEMLLHQIPPGDRQSFEAYYQERLHAMLAAAEAVAGASAEGGADHDAVEAEVLTALIREAEGVDEPDGLGFVPHPDPAVRGYELQPPVTDPRGRRPHRRTGSLLALGRNRLGLAAGVLVLAATGLGWTVTRTSAGQTDQASTATSPMRIAPSPAPPIEPLAAALMPTTTPLLGGNQGAGDAGVRVEVVDPASLDLQQPDGAHAVFRVVAMPGRLGSLWQPAPAPGTAAWLQGSYVNVVLCLGPDAGAALRDTARGRPIVIRTNSGTTRHYEVLRVRAVERQQTEVLDQRRAGLTLLLCATPDDGPDRGGSATRTVVEAVYRPETLAQQLPGPGTPVGLGDLARVAVQSVHVLTRTADLVGASGEAIMDLVLAVEVDNLQDTPLQWQDLADQLEVDGRMAEAVPDAAGSPARSPLAGHERRMIELRYRVPAPADAASMPAIWHMLAPTGEQVSVEVALPQPAPVPDLEATLLADGIHQMDAPATGIAGQQLLLPLMLRNTSGITIPLRPDAIAVWDGATLLPVLTPLPPAIAPGASQTLLLVTPAPEGKMLIVTAGRRRWHVQLP